MNVEADDGKLITLDKHGVYKHNQVGAGNGVFMDSLFIGYREPETHKKIRGIYIPDEGNRIEFYLNGEIIKTLKADGSWE